MSHWVTATKICFVYRTESLQQTDLLFIALSHCDKQNLYMFPKRCQKVQKKRRTFCYLLHFTALFVPFRQFCAVFFVYFLHFWHVLPFFSATNNNFVWRSDSVWQKKNPFVAVTQCDKQNKSLSQWLSATNNFERNIQFCCGMWKGIGKKPKNKHYFKIEFHHRYQIALGFLQNYMNLNKSE